MKKWIKTVPFLIAFALILIVGRGVNVYAANGDANVIPKGVYIGDVDVSGMTAKEAESAIFNYVQDISDNTIVLTANGNEIETTLAALGVDGRADVSVSQALNYGKTGNLVSRYKILKDLEKKSVTLPLSLDVDRNLAASFLDANRVEVDIKAKDYTLEANSDGSMSVVEGEEGSEIIVDQSIDAIVDYFSEGWVDNPKIELVTEVTQPKGSPEELAQVKDVLGTYTTNYASSTSNRATNVHTGMSKVNGTILYPGDQFSMYKTVAPFDEEHGYALAPSYENGTTVDSYGGGICQVSTTLYNAVIRAELQVDERYGHSMTVSYVDPSSDAAISGTTQDFKFTNNTDAPIFIAGWADGVNITFVIYGHETRPANREVTFESETLNTTDFTIKYVASYEDAIGYYMQTQTPHTGVEACLWKIVTVDGIEESRTQYNFTNYAMSPLIYTVGVSATTPDATNAVCQAINTQDENVILQAVYAYMGYGIPNYN